MCFLILQQEKMDKKVSQKNISTFSRKMEKEISAPTPGTLKMEEDPTPENEGMLDFLLSLLPASASTKKRKRLEMQQSIDEAEAIRYVENISSVFNY